MSDNLIDIDLLELYDKNIKEVATILQRNTDYVLDDIVHKGQIYLKCKTAGKTDITALSLSGLSIGDTVTDNTVVWEVINPFGNTISNWKVNTEYDVDDLIFFNNVLYKCKTAHTSSITFNTTNWDRIGGVTDWTTQKQYMIYDVVFYNDNVYLCIVPHTSTTFTDDENKWLKITGSGSGSGGLTQVTKLDAVAGTGVDIEIPATTTFKLAPVEVLKYTRGTEDISTNVFTMGVGDGSKFTVDGISADESPLVIFDGYAKPNHQIEFKFSDPIQLDTKYYSESEEIDANDFKVIEEVSLV